MLSWFWSWLASNPSQFPGGLSQTDWFGLGSGLLGTGYGWFGYNLSQYTAGVGWRQAQLYQKVNYGISWVSIARDDIRELMSISVNRINNYMLVATLILGVSADALFWINNFDKSTPSFLINYFWLSIGLSILFLALAILFGIKGQNSAFVNTMRLLTWEVRPENPGKYSYDYTKQVQRWEGAKSLFRLPSRQDRGEQGMSFASKLWSKSRMTTMEEKLTGNAPHGDASATPAGSPVTEDGEKTRRAPSASNTLSSLSQPGQEDAEPACDSAEQDVTAEVNADTRELVYLWRFAHFMRLWAPFEYYSRFCIGMGFICLAQGASFFCMGALPLDDVSGIYQRSLIMCMIIIFAFLCAVIFHANYTTGYASAHYVAVALFTLGPIAALASTFFKTAQNVLAPAASLVQTACFFASTVVVARSKGQLPRELTERYVTGTNGQRFSQDLDRTAHQPLSETHCTMQRGEGRPAQQATLSSHEEILTEHLSSGPASGPEWHSDPNSIDPYVPSSQEELTEELEVQAVLERVVNIVIACLSLSTLLWFVVFTLTEMDLYGFIGPGKLPSVTILEEIPVTWPAMQIEMKSMACFGHQVFLASKFSIYRLDEDDGQLQEEDCDVPGRIADIAATCDRRGRHCWPLALAEAPRTDDEEGPSRTNLIDCMYSKNIYLARERSAGEFVAMRAVGNGLSEGNGSLLAVHHGRLMRYGWSRGNWAPKWEHTLEDYTIRSIDILGSDLLKFGTQHINGHRGNISVVEVMDLSTGEDIGKWRFPVNFPDIVQGCAFREGFLVLTKERPPRLLRVDIPGYDFH